MPATAVFAQPHLSLCQVRHTVTEKAVHGSMVEVALAQWEAVQEGDRQAMLTLLLAGCGNISSLSELTDQLPAPLLREECPICLSAPPIRFPPAPSPPPRPAA